MNQDGQTYKALVLVDAESGHLAREAVVGQMTEKMMTDSTPFSLPFLEPVQVATEEGMATVNSFWQEYIGQGVKDVDAVLVEIAESNVLEYIQEGHRRALLESWAFRSACLRIGTIDSWPIRIYYMGIGINNRSILDTVVKDEPGLWAVEVQLR
jgi:hypothetical protein